MGTVQEIPFRAGHMGVLVAAVIAVAAPGTAQAKVVTVDNTALGNADRPGCGVAGNAPCATIGYPVGLITTDPGDTIAVGAGVYPELVTVDKPLAFRGAQAGIDARGRAAVPETVMSGSTGAFAIGASGVTIDGFTVTGVTDASAMGDAAIMASNSGGGRVIENTVFAGSRRGISLGSATTGAVAPTIVRGNAFRDIAGTAIHSTGGLRNARIHANQFRGSAGRDIVVDGRTGDAGHIRVRNNDMTKSLAVAHVHDVAIGANTIRNTPGAAVLIKDRSTRVGIAGNTLTANTRGAAVSVAAGGYLGTLAVHYNRIAGNATGVSNRSSATARIDAEDNWWGRNAGPNTTGADTTSRGVDADPWLVLRAKAPDRVAAGDLSPLAASLRRNSDRRYLGPIPFPRTPVPFALSAGATVATGYIVAGLGGSVFRAPEATGRAIGAITLDRQPVRMRIGVSR